MYADTEVGARFCLSKLSTLDVFGASAKPDPKVRGVWLITCMTGEKAIVYLAGYKDPFGRVRQKDDFEVIHSKEEQCEEAKSPQSSEQTTDSSQE